MVDRELVEMRAGPAGRAACKHVITPSGLGRSLNISRRRHTAAASSARQPDAH